MGDSYNPNYYNITCNDDNNDYNVWSNTYNGIVAPTGSSNITVNRQLTTDVLSPDINNNQRVVLEPHITSTTLNTSIVNLKFEYYFNEGIVSYKNTGVAYGHFNSAGSRLDIFTGSNADNEDYTSSNINNHRCVAQSIIYPFILTDTIRRSTLTFSLSNLDDIHADVGIFDNHNDKNHSYDTQGNGIFLHYGHEDGYKIVCRTSYYNNTQEDIEYPQSEWNICTFSNSVDTAYNLDIRNTTTLVIDQLCNENGYTTIGFFTYKGIEWAHRIVHNDDQRNILKRYQLPARFHLENYSLLEDKYLYIYSLSMVTNHNVASRPFVKAIEISSKTINTSYRDIFSTRLCVNNVRLFAKLVDIEYFADVPTETELFIGTYMLPTMSNWYESGALCVNELDDTYPGIGTLQYVKFGAANVPGNIHFGGKAGQIMVAGDFIATLEGYPVNFTVKTKSLSGTGTFRCSFLYEHY